MTFDELARPGVCQVCGSNRPVAVFSSSMGACSFAYCKTCWANHAEPYEAMVAYISCAGRYPDDINDAYIAIVRQNLYYLGRSEEEFIADVEMALQKELEYFQYMEENKDAMAYHEREDIFEPER